ncbi:MAG: flippase-like domain-containing protein [Acidimicrobiales bacterium]|nr:flippase-like domain-containing protein [Acidimicrobiales bacterium]
MPAPAEVGGEEREIVAWVRYPADGARLVLAVAIWLLITGFALQRPDQTEGLAVDVVGLVDGLPGVVTEVVVGLLQLAALVVPFSVLVLARRRRWRELAHAIAAAGVTAVLSALTGGWLAETVPPVVLDAADEPSWVAGAAFPSGTYLAAVAAAVTVVAPSLNRPWRRTVWWSVVVVGVARVVTAVASPVGLVAPVALGIAVGSAVMLVARSPLRSPSPAAVAAALRRAGLGEAEVEATEHRHRHGPTYRARLGERTAFVKLVGRDERNAQLLLRLAHALRVDGPDDRFTAGARETIEHEALMLALAARAGARVPEVLAVASTDEGAAVLVMEDVAGRPLDEGDEPDDAQLADAFAQLAALHRARLAHGWASLSQLLVGDDGQVRLLDLRWATPGASDELLAADLAELVASAAARVGIDRAVAAARTAFDDEALGATLAYLQPLATTPETRKAAKPLLADLRTAVQEATGVEAYEMAELERLSVQKVVMFIGTLVLAFFLLVMLGNAAEIWDALGEMDVAYLPLLLVISLLGFPAGAISLMGAVNVRLKLWATTEMMLAQSFLNRFTPANAGGMALRTRYLQTNGVSLLTAASAVGLTSAASGVMQVVMAFTFFTWAGQDDTSTTISLPSTTLIVAVLLAVGALIGAAWATTAGRKLLTTAWSSIASSLRDFRELARHPSKLIMLFFGAGASKLISILALAQTMAAFGQPIDLAAIGAMYITATTVAAAVPTPGGVGPIEAALTAGLVGMGVDPGEAAAIVVIFRLATYWLPTIPSWYALHRMEKAGNV